jgi:methylated-DNA-[protein]-cysteine S-methyltransferase
MGAGYSKRAPPGNRRIRASEHLLNFWPVGIAFRRMEESQSSVETSPRPAAAPAGRSFVWTSPIGPLTLRSDGDALTSLQFGGGEAAKQPAPDAVLRAAIRELEAYFARKLQVFEIPIREQGTPFQRRVWQKLRDIPFGRTRSYVDVARSLGQPAAMRAVGAANAANPIVIVTPCHRVIGAKGALVGFGGGLNRKRLLLETEGVFLPLG